MRRHCERSAAISLSVRYGIGLMLAGLHTLLDIGLIETLFPQVRG